MVKYAIYRKTRRKVITDLRAKTCCFTGHRNLSSGEKLKAAVRLRKVIAEQIKAGIVFYGAGGALGFDTLAAKTVLDIMVYEDIKRRSDKVVYVSREYTPDCIHRRNRHLVDHSGTCIC